MGRIRSNFLATIVAVSIAAVAAVCWHSVQEIHYLKSFYPRQFTVQEAFYAAAMELVKVMIIALPLIFIAAVCLYLLRHSKNER